MSKKDNVPIILGAGDKPQHTIIAYRDKRFPDCITLSLCYRSNDSDLCCSIKSDDDIEGVMKECGAEIGKICFASKESIERVIEVLELAKSRLEDIQYEKGLKQSLKLN